jgi:hypothetical protein
MSAIDDLLKLFDSDDVPTKHKTPEQRKDVKQRLKDLLTGEWRSIPELAQEIYGDYDRTKYSSTQRAVSQLEKKGHVQRREGSNGLKFTARADAPKETKDWDLFRDPPMWTKDIREWWDESCGTVENVFDLKSPVENPQTGERGKPTTTVCAWTVLWRNAGGHYDDNWFLNVVDQSDKHLYFEALDYIKMGINDRELLDYVLDMEVGDSVKGRMRELIGQSRPRRPETTASWNYEIGRRTLGGTRLAPRFRDGWGPRYEEKKLIGHYGMARVARWSWDVILRLNDEHLKSPSLLLECKNMGYPLNDLLKMSDEQIREKHKTLRETTVIVR